MNMKKIIERGFEIPEYVSGDIKLMDINQVKPVVIDQVKPIVIRFDFFRQGSTGAFDRRVLFKKPGLFQRIDRQAIMSEAHFRCAEIAEDYINKNVVLEIYLSRQDIARKKRLRYIQESYHSFTYSFSESGIEYRVIFEPLMKTLNIM